MSKTRSGAVYKLEEAAMEATAQGNQNLRQENENETSGIIEVEEPHQAAQAAALSGDKDEIIRLLMEDKRRQEEQMERLMRMLESTHTSTTTVVAASPPSRDEPRVAKLTESDDIEAYLTTFERQMTAFDVSRAKWTVKLAPHLTGRAQQAYAAISTEEAKDYTRVKDAILHRYNINEETYRQRFRSATQKKEESNRELVVRLQDLQSKWMREYETVQDISNAIVMEQFLNTVPREVRIWLLERKPKSPIEAGELADKYWQARRSVAENQSSESRNKSRKCHKCQQPGHIAKDCPKGKEDENTPKGSEGAGPGKSRPKQEVRCYNCNTKGHIASKCPHNAMFCEGTGQRELHSVYRQGSVEGNQVHDLVLDTGCQQTIVHQRLVPEFRKMEGEAVTVRCAHGDTVLYPLAEVKMEVDGIHLKVRAAVSDCLPVSVLLGTDVPELKRLLGGGSRSYDSVSTIREALVVTRAMGRQEQQEEEARLLKEKTSEVCATPLEEEVVAEHVTGESSSAVQELPEADADSIDDIDGEESVVGTRFDPDIFQGSTAKKLKQTRSQKRQDRHNAGLERAKDLPREGTVVGSKLSASREELQSQQATDESLAGMRSHAQNESKWGSRISGGKVFWKDGLLWHQWRPKGQEDWVDHLVLPHSYRKEVLELAHCIPLAGHLGRKKTTSRILRRFYWPTLHRDVADFCRSCEVCQKFCKKGSSKAKMVPLPIIAEPFSRVAMDIVGPLPRSRSGNRYVLVLCDYATRFPEAIPLKSIDAEHIAEELMKIFARVGIPQEILTDQGSNFQSQLLAELYRLLHVEGLRTSPYHPQTDGLVERFNQTLKAMLKKTAVDEGKDWDKLIPFLLFAYREVPQESTGYSPFELLYGRELRGPLDVVKESWEARNKSSESVVSYVLQMREKLEKMEAHVRVNMEEARRQQKTWYDKNARERSFKAGDQVLILLPTSNSKLEAQWQGPYEVIKPVGVVNYLVHLHDRKKSKRVFHINMLREWHAPISTSYLAQIADEEAEEEDIPNWNDAGGTPTLGDQLSVEQKKELQTLLDEFCSVFQTKPGKTSLAEHCIQVVDNQPVRLPPYRLPQAYKESVKKEIQEMLEHGIIEPSSSDWSSPMVIVKKKDKTVRVCVDFRKLNAKSKMDAYPMPRVDDMIDLVGSARYVSTLDLTKGYWQVPVREEDRDKTAFSTPFGLFQFKRMPFGLHGAPATFQRMVDKLLNGMQDSAGAYIDDVVVYSDTWEEHLQHLRQVLERLKKVQLTAKLRKCQFGTARCVYLGHVIGGGQVRLEEAKVEAVASYPIPTTKKGVRSFLGLTGYYRKFIPDYATIATPLTDLTRKNQPVRIQWSKECDAAFNTLKARICSRPVLASPDFTKEFILQTDASDRGVGAVLSQLDNDGNDHPVAFFSKKLLPREEKYATIEKECLAVKLGIQAFKTYLSGRHFVIETDHRALEWLDRIKDSNARLTRWSIFLQDYDFTIRYRPGQCNGNADAMSRVEMPFSN